MTQPQSNWVGHTIANRYKLEAVLGQGGMSTVYKATDSNLRRAVAVKVIHPHLSSDPEFVRRFEQEAAAVAQLRHPNIIQVYDFNHEDTIYYIVLEYISGETLQDRLKALNTVNQRLSLAEAIQLMVTICEAAAYAHERGMIHRDLKPANVMLNSLGQPILMDFGVAKMLGNTHVTATGTIIGTALYMSPEQARGEHPDKRTDIYSLGVILYEMITGHPPFEADSDIAILMKHVSLPVPDIRQIHRDTPNLLVAVIEKALAKEPTDRYQNAVDMARALRAVDLYPSGVYPSASSTVYTSTPPSYVAPPIQPIRKAGPPLWLMGLAVILILLLLGLGLFFFAFRFFQPPVEEQALTAPTEQTATPAEAEASSLPEEKEATTPAEAGLVSAEIENLPSSRDMIKVDAGLYTVGRETLSQNYAPLKQVELTEFWLDQYEVTNAQYAEFIAATAQVPPAKWPEGEVPGGQEQHPVRGITWEQAAAYCAWGNKRLPAEAEWEIAARGVEDHLYPWGDDQNGVKLPQNDTYEVGSIAANRSSFGAYDMAGNVWEWVGDTYAPVEEGHRVLRGGENGFLKDMAYRLSGPSDQESIIKTAGIRCAADQVELVPGANMLYEDGFLDTSGAWPVEDVEGKSYRIGYHPPDHYHVEVRTPEEYHVVSHGESYADVTIETAVLVDHTDTEQGDYRYGLVARWSGEEQYYAFTVDPRAGSWQVLKRTPQGLDELATGETELLRGFAPAGFTPDKPDKLRVDAQGSNFVFWINNELVGQVRDDQYAGGQVGFYVETFDETLAHLHYDTLTVREVEPVPELMTNVFYQDGFVDTSGEWPEEDVEDNSYRIGYHPPDYYHVEVRAPDEYLAVRHGEEYGDATVETAVLVDHTDTEQGDYRYGLTLRQSGEEQYYAFTVDPRAGSWQVLKRTPQGLDELATGETELLRGFAPAGFTPDKPDKLRVDARGSDFAFWVNDEVVGQVSDDQYTSGQVGFYVETFDETLAHLHYDSLTVREVEAGAFEVAATPVEPTPTPAPPEGMVLIPAGYFQMGSSSGQANEKPEHPVFLDAFYLDLYEVTNAHYRECVQARSCTQAGPNSATRQGYRDDPAFETYPVVGVTWDQADAYCKWAGKHLPTEAQWEYAASGPESFVWPWGDTFQTNLLPAAEADTQPIGSYAEGVSPFGVFDMAGNVAEWVADDYDETFYATSPPSNPFSTGVSAGRIFRGGSFGQQERTLYTTSRRDGNVRTYSDVRVGFRCTQDVPEVTGPDDRAAIVAEFCELYTSYKSEALCP